MSTQPTCPTCHRLLYTRHHTRKQLGSLPWIGHEMRAYRVAKGLTQIELALELGYSQKTISAIENGRSGVTQEFYKNWQTLMKREQPLAEMPTKICAKCKRSKPITDYTRDRSRPDKLRVYCRKCDHARLKQYKAA